MQKTMDVVMCLAAFFVIPTLASWIYEDYPRSPWRQLAGFLTFVVGMNGLNIAAYAVSGDSMYLVLSFMPPMPGFLFNFASSLVFTPPSRRDFADHREGRKKRDAAMLAVPAATSVGTSRCG